MRENKGFGQEGYIALFSIIMIMAILLVLSVSVGMFGFYDRLGAWHYEAKRQSLALAEGCDSVALLKLSIDSTYNPHDELIPVGDQHCTIVSVVSADGQSVIQTRGVTALNAGSNAVTALKVTATANGKTFVINSWEEVSGF